MEKAFNKSSLAHIEKNAKYMAENHTNCVSTSATREVLPIPWSARRAASTTRSCSPTRALLVRGLHSWLVCYIVVAARVALFLMTWLW